MFKIKSITIKLFFLFLFVGIVPLFLVGDLSIRSTEQGIRNEIFNGLVRYTEAKEGQIFAYIDFIKAKGRYLSADSFLVEKIEANKRGQGGSSLEMNNFLKDRKNLDKSLVGVSILDLNGKVIFSSSESEVGKDESNHAHFIEVIEKGEYVSIKSGLMNHKHFGLYNAFIGSYPIKNKKGEVLAVMDVVFDLNNLTEVLNGNFQLEEGALTGISGLEELNNYVVNKEKVMFIHPTIAIEGQMHSEKMEIDNLPIKECLENNKEIVDVYKTYTGKEVLGASMCIVDRGWVIVSEVEIDKAFLAVKDIYYQLVLMMIVSLLLVIGISLLLTDRVARYLNKFITASRGVTNGNFDVSIDINSEDEIGFLAKNFNKMIVSLKKSRFNIEKEILERTRDLENINKYMVGREIKMIELKEKIKNMESGNYKGERKEDWEESLKNTEEMEEDIILKLKNSYLRAIKESDLEKNKKDKAIELIKELIKDSIKHKKFLIKLNKE